MMNVSESNEGKRLLVLMGKHFPNTVLFRNNTGMGWVGEIVNQTGNTITLANYRPLHAGLIKGSSDNIGWTPVLITPEMVGKTVALFTAVENKKLKSGRIKAEQQQFIDNVNNAGGIGVFAFSPELGVDAFKAHPLSTYTTR